ncbi:Fic family protein [Anaerophaga thermohalophila]|uniref:Fic family protein n=1 Tax=Anaerophaga thermohalophila TaxID=177400 RepID=UPI000237D223|nr:Fic family protein [Anaerophaga thermohalophila]
MSSLILKNTGNKYNMIEGSFDASKGEFRKGSVHAGNRSFANHKKVPSLVEKLVDYINQTIDKPEKRDFVENSKLAFDAHFQMVSIHPFADGNGRLARLLMNYVQHYQNHPITTVLSKDKKAYFKALEETREKEDINIFRQFMFDQSKKFFKQEIETLSNPQRLKKNNKNGLSFLF